MTELLQAYGDAGRFFGTLDEFASRVRWLRGRALVERLLPRRSGVVLFADSYDEHEERTRSDHRGRVLALGPPALVASRAGAVEVPWDCEVGDTVLYVYAVTMQKLRTFVVEDPDAGRRELVVLAQEEIVGVIDD